MDEETRDKLNTLYGLTTDIHQMNIQILKNQKRALLMEFISDKKLIEETDNILRQMTNGEYKP